MVGCKHDEVNCLNQYELIRKYRCLFCNAVMMCSCDEIIGRKFLPHQLNYGTELESKKTIRVTLGFQSSICRECRGLIPQAHPVAEIYGRTSKFQRYYWRELSFRAMELFAEWAEARGLNPGEAYLSPSEKYGKEVSIAKKRAIEQAHTEIKSLHLENPKYEFKEESQADIIKRYDVGILNLKATYLKKSISKKSQVLDSGELVSVEEFVCRYFSRLGYNVMFLESAPFHVLFGVYMWLLIQDPADPQVRLVGFGERNDFKVGRKQRIIWTHLPDDFGSSGYGSRRAAEIEKHLSLDRLNRDDLLWHFDYWLDYSNDLRQYLWAHRDEHIKKTRKLIEILPAEIICRILKYLVENYWHRYLGWPDMLVFRGSEYSFVEVKSSNDKIREDQKAWIKGNYEILKLPFQIVKVHKTSTIETLT